MNVSLREHLRETLLEVAKPIHKNLRGKKIELFLELVGGASLKADAFARIVEAAEKTSH